MSDHRPFALPGARAQYGPDKTVEVLHIDLHLRPDLERERLDGVATTTVRALEDGIDALHLDAVDLTIGSVRDASGRDLAFRSTSRSLTITPAQPLRAGDAYTFAIAYAVEAARSGIYFIRREPKHVWTQSQDQDARAWFPCFDHPSRKQTSSATVVVPKGMFALANGALVERSETAEGTVFRYEQREPHPTYLMTLVAGPFSEVRQEHARLPVFYYTLPGREADGERAFGPTPQMIDVFERVTGVPYAFARYSQIAVADFIFGGMENTSATTQTDRVLHDERAHLDYDGDWLTSHELAHQWFGDLVTCRDWAHAWLNEGFATYFEAVWAEAAKGWDEYQHLIFENVANYLEEDGDRYRRPIVCSIYRDPIELFDRHLYQKGGAVLHMLRGELGWERMRRALRRYLTDNRFRNVETIDLVRAIEAETGRNIRGFVDQWITRGGHPEIEAAYRWDAERGVALLTIRQKQTVDDDHPAYVFDLDAGFVTPPPPAAGRDAGDAPLPGERRIRLTVDAAERTFAIPLDVEPALVRIDPGAYVLGSWTYAFGTDMHAQIVRAEPSPTARIRAAKALAKDGGRAAREALATGLASDPFWATAAEIAVALGATRAPYARAALLANVGHAHPKVRRAVAGALGNFRGADVADALLGLRDDASYFVVAAALESLGKTRDARAYDALVAGLELPSWNGVIGAGAVRGLGALGDGRALPHLLASLASDRPEGVRRAALGALATLANTVDEVRARAVDAIERALEDEAYLVRVSAYGAAETLADARLLGALDRLAVAEGDGRLRRDAAEAAIRVREAASKPAELARVREEMDRLREETRTLRERLDALDVR